MDFTLTLSADALKKALIDTGVPLQRTVTLTVPIAELSREARATLVHAGASFRDPGWDYALNQWEVEAVPTTPAEWEDLCAAYRAEVASVKEERQAKRARDLRSALDTLAALESQPIEDIGGTYLLPLLPSGPEPAYQEFLERHTLLATAIEEHRRAKEEAAQRRDAEQQQRQQADRAAWIAAHGSARLQRATAAGYPCKRQYIVERAALECPGFVVDFQDESAWEELACPSEAALDCMDAHQEHGARAVWLTLLSGPLYQDEGFEPQEAVVIEGYLGAYTLLKMFH